MIPDRSAARLIAGLLAAVLVAGCASRSPAPERADVPLPDRLGEGAGSPVPGEWWQHFDDPALDDVMDRVVDDSFSLAAARSRLRQARAAARGEAGGRLPTLDATGDASATRSDGQTTEEYAAGAMASYEVDLWGRLDAAAEAAALEAEATERDLRAAGISLTAEAASAYYGILRERALRELIRDQIDTNRRIEELVELRYRRGNAGADELLRQRQLVESTTSELASVAGELERLRAELAALQGRPGPDALALPESAELVDVPPLPEAGVPSEWLRRRPDLEAAFLRVQAADAELASAIAARYPRLDLSASLESAAASPSALFQDWIGQIAAGLTVPLFRGGQLEADVDRTRAARDVAFNEYAQTVLDAVAGVESALAAERADRSRVASLEKQVTLGERVLEQLRYRYRNGGADFLDVLDAQTTLQDNQRSLLEARWALVADRIELVRTLAGGWPADTADNAGTEDNPDANESN